VISNWVIAYSEQAQKNAKHLTRSGLRPKAEPLLAIIEHDLYQTPPRFERLVGELSGLYSRRINYQHCHAHAKQITALKGQLFGEKSSELLSF
jgi:Txe/YoeB family toxin of toxin-antitoxin system